MLRSAAGKEAKLALLTSTALDDQRSHRMVDVIRLLAQCFSVSRLRNRRAKRAEAKASMLDAKRLSRSSKRTSSTTAKYYSAAAAEYR